ncbi:hypothetical protein niasHT_038331 [Heterodera trifolii]|uniref:Uncharacterized protein n=1 Tax=Heterodera trifolii TaxID=157864 RepID=A0ABD2I7U5_9BILA
MTASSSNNNNRPNSNSATNEEQQQNGGAKIRYRATISPPGRYAVIAWDGILNEEDKECQQKFVLPTKNKEKLHFFTNALDATDQLAKCFKHFYMAHSDANGQFELRHNLLAEDEANAGIWCNIFGSADWLTKLWFGRGEKRQKIDEDDPLRIVQLQILPLTSKGKPIPSVNNNNNNANTNNNANIVAAQTMRKYKAEELSNANGTNDEGPSAQNGGEGICYHSADKRQKIVIDFINQWAKLSIEAESSFFLVAYLRFLVVEVEKMSQKGNLSGRDSVVALMANYDAKIVVLMLKYSDALIMAFQRFRRLLLIGVFDANFLKEMLGMVNRMCSFFKKVPQKAKMYGNWPKFCENLDTSYAQFSKKRNKFVLSLLDRCLFGREICIDQQSFYYVEHLVFQVEWIASDKWSTSAQINGHDQNFLAQIGQILSVSKANKIEDSQTPILSYFESNAPTLFRMNALFGRLCQNWQIFLAKFNDKKTKFSAWTELCKKNVFKEFYQQK